MKTINVRFDSVHLRIPFSLLDPSLSLLLSLSAAIFLLRHCLFRLLNFKWIKCTLYVRIVINHVVSNLFVSRTRRRSNDDDDGRFFISKTNSYYIYEKIVWNVISLRLYLYFSFSFSNSVYRACRIIIAWECQDTKETVKTVWTGANE